MGNAAIQQAAIYNIQKRIPNAQLFGFSLNPEDTQWRHKIPSYSIVRRKDPTARVKDEGDSASKDADATALAEAQGHQGNRAGGLKQWIKKNPALMRIVRLVQKPLGWLQTAWEELAYCAKCYRILKPLDMFILSGGGALDEGWGGSWKTPYIILRWSILARLAGVRYLVVSVGVERLESPLSRFFIRRAMHLASYRSFRDNYSKEFVARICGCDGLMVPDLAFSLADANLPARERTAGFRGVVGVSPMDYLDPRSWPRKDARQYQQYIATMAEFSRWLLDRGYAVRFFPSDIHMDKLAIADVMAQLNSGGASYSRDQVRDERVTIVAELVEQIAAMDFMVACRFHGVVLSHRMQTPVMAVSYDPKVNRLMTDVGLPQYCFTIETLKLEEMKSTFEELEKNREKVKAHIGEIVRGYRVLLEDQYDRIFPSST
jgi:polysaccharide pyruvyl transferase WcaK-like protein